MTLPMNNDYHSTHLLEIVEERQPLDKNIISKSNINVRDKKGRNALYWAIKNHSKRNVGLLLEHNISLTVASKLDAFFHAIASQNLDALMELCSVGLNVDVQNDKGQSLLMKAIEAEIKNGANIYEVFQNKIASLSCCTHVRPVKINFDAKCMNFHQGCNTPKILTLRKKFENLIKFNVKSHHVIPFQLN